MSSMDKLRFQTAAVLLIVCALKVMGQNNADFEIWTGVKANYKISKKLRIDLRNQVRLEQNASQFQQNFTQLGLRYKFTDYLSIAGATRFIMENADADPSTPVEQLLRWQTDLELSPETGRFSPSFRLRYQNKNEIELLGLDPTQRLRYKFGLDYNFRKWKLDPEAAIELFDKIQNTDGIYKLRYTLGTTYSLNKKIDLRFYIRREDRLDRNESANILYLRLNYSIN